MNSSKPIYLLILVLFIVACDSGGYVDLVPDPEEPFISSEGLDTADMNGDGLTDIVVAGNFIPVDGPATGHIDILLQDIGNPGTFLAPQRFQTSSRPWKLKLADLNGDLLPDVIATSGFSENSFDVLLNDPLSPGQLGVSTKYSTGSRPGQIETGDIDRDGFTDIVVAGDHVVVWHRQLASGSFNSSQVAGNGVDMLALEDLDGDGLLDLVTQDGTLDGNLLVYMQSAAMPGNFNPPQSLRLGTFLKALTLGDLNRDGRTDIAAVGGDSKDIADFFGVWYPVLETSSNPPTFTVQPRYGTASSFNTQTVDIVDMNGDGRADVVTGNWNGAGSQCSVEVILQTDTPGMFRQDRFYFLPANTEPHIGNDMNAVSIADLNGDLLPDIAVSNNRVYVLLQKQGEPGRFGDPILVLGLQP